MSASNKIKVLIVDDSALVRQVLSELINHDKTLEVVGTASDPFIAADKIKSVRPDVILLDVEMPKMDGLTFLKKLMSQHPIPVIICSTLVANKSDTYLKALELGAVEIIEKPTMGLKQYASEHKDKFLQAIQAAAQAKLKPYVARKTPATKHTADAVLKKPSTKAMLETTERIIAIGASTGGTEAIRTVLLDMPMNCPAIVVVQHMPEGFTKSFSERLNQQCIIQVHEAKGGETLIRGHAYIAPGNKHMLVKRSGAKYYLDLQDGPPVSRHKPSVDVLMRSVALYAGKNAVGCILTGMGSDGAEGMLELRNTGAKTFGQDEKSSVVYGMPKEAFLRGGISTQLPLNQMAANLLQAAK